MLPLRTELLGCYSDHDFLAKLHCVRQAFEVGCGSGRLGRMESGRRVVRRVSCWACSHLAPLCRWATCLTHCTARFVAVGACQVAAHSSPIP